MHKTPARKKYARNHHAWNAAILKNLQKNAKQIIAKSIDNARDKSDAMQDYVSERPVKAVGFSLIPRLFHP